MAVTITNNLTLISQAENDTDGGTWAAFGGAASFGANTDIFKEGTASLGAKLSNGSGGIQITLASARNMTGEHVYVWANIITPLRPAGTGLRIFLGDGTNTNEYEIFDENTYGGGWVRLVLQADATPTVDNTADISAITIIGVEFDTATQVKGNFSTIFVDRIDVQTSATTYAITVGGGTAGDRGKWSEIIADSTAGNDLGIVERKNGIVSLNGPIEFGDTGTATTFFEDIGETIVFQDQFVENGFFALEFVGNATGTNHFQLGTETGTPPDSVGSGGGSIITSGPLFNIVSSDSNVDVAALFGVVIDGANLITWAQTNAKSVSTSLLNSGKLSINNGAEWRDGVVSDTVEPSTSAGVELLTTPTDPEFRDMLIQNCLRGIEISTAGTYAMRNIRFAGNTFDTLTNHASGEVTYQVLEGGDSPTNENTGGGTFVIENTVDLNVTVKSAATGNGISGIRVWIEEDPISLPSIAEGETDSTGLFTSTFNFTGNQNVIVRARKRGLIPVEITDTITSSGLNVPITMTEDVVDRI